MTETTNLSRDERGPVDQGGAGVHRPAEGRPGQPGQTPGEPGGVVVGAAGAGGPDGFGTGT